MDQDTKKRIVTQATKLAGRTTFHGKDGKFSNPDGAHSATRNGERLRIVRQLRKLHRGPKKEATDKAMQIVLRSNLAKTKATLTGALTAPGWINVGDAIFGD